MSRPHTSGRALRAHFTPLALSSLGVISLIAAPAGTVPSDAMASAPPSGASASQVAATSASPITPGGLAADGGIAAALPSAQSDPFATPSRSRLAFKAVRRELNVLDGRSTTVLGALLPARAGHAIDLQRHDGRDWRTVARAFTGRRGRFLLRYTPRRLRPERLRLLFPGDGAARSAARAIGVLSVYRLAGASWYGGGGSLACGGWLTSATLGVANKTLPCGTLVTLRYGGPSIRVPVIDRGPYVPGRDFDLTEATKRALGFEGVGEVWSSR